MFGPGGRSAQLLGVMWLLPAPPLSRAPVASLPIKSSMMSLGKSWGGEGMGRMHGSKLARHQQAREPCWQLVGYPSHRTFAAQPSKLSLQFGNE